MNRKKILEVKNLSIGFRSKIDAPIVTVIENLSFDIFEGQVFGVAGESGSGKSVTFLSVLNLLPFPQGVLLGGEIIFKGSPLTDMKDTMWHEYRGKEISMIFQDPFSTLNPLLTIGKQLLEALPKRLTSVGEDQKKEAIFSVLRQVGLPSDEGFLDTFPHQLSGGMSQRVQIATSLLLEPSLIIADEPTTALDVTIQAEVISLLKELKKNNPALTIVMISHDLALIEQICDRVMIMYGGQLVEEGSMKRVLSSPHHPYTEGLIRCSPQLHYSKDRLPIIEGQIPAPEHFPEHCRFSNRCPQFKNEKSCRGDQILSISVDQSSRCTLKGANGGNG